MRQLELVRLLGELSRRGDVQFTIATHSPIILAFPGAEISSFDVRPIRRVTYEETDYYRIYHDFLNDRAKFLDGI
jgi:predicted ATPase